MKKLTCLPAFFILWLMPGIIFSQTKATLNLPTMNAEAGAIIDVPIIVSTNETIAAAQFVVEYNSAVLTFVSAESGPDASGFSFDCNPDLPYGPTGQGTDENVLTQVFGDLAHTFTGQSRQVVNLKFTVTGNPGQYSPLIFDQGVVRTYLTTNTFQDIYGSNISFSNGSINFVVPVELSAFNATVKQDHVLLEWRTETETNNFGFEIQRSEKADEFLKIGFVPGRQTTSQPQRYSYLDNDIFSGTFSYRLKQIDTDGSFYFSATRTVTITAPKEARLTECYPNPFNPATTIHYEISNAEIGIQKVEVIVYNSLGEKVRTLVNDEMSAGFYSVVWNGRNDSGDSVASGTYLCLMRVNGKIGQSLKMTFLR
ncbi:MAG: FlgD immunoglobulin-like domain containing protein [Candidatus Zhuqueibacterota bacterium]